MKPTSDLGLILRGPDNNWRPPPFPASPHFARSTHGHAVLCFDNHLNNQIGFIEWCEISDAPQRIRVMRTIGIWETIEI